MCRTLMKARDQEPSAEQRTRKRTAKGGEDVSLFSQPLRVCSSALLSRFQQLRGLSLQGERGQGEVWSAPLPLATPASPCL